MRAAHDHVGTRLAYCENRIHHHDVAMRTFFGTFLIFASLACATAAGLLWSETGNPAHAVGGGIVLVIAWAILPFPAPLATAGSTLLSKGGKLDTRHPAILFPVVMCLCQIGAATAFGWSYFPEFFSHDMSVVTAFAWAPIISGAVPLIWIASDFLTRRPHEAQ